MRFPFGWLFVGSLALNDEGNQSRFKAANGCTAVVDALRDHGENLEVAEFACRAIFNLCADPQNVGELGQQGCGLVVSVLRTHMTKAPVVTQALLALHSLAVKWKADKPHKGNTKKLVKEGAIEMVVSAMQVSNLIIIIIIL